MLYILDQRLRAQKIPEEKARKVKRDIVGMMMNRRFMEELFKLQEMYPRRSIRTLFDRLAHSSIMRLNDSSMDKLYDLMTMAVKYQIYMCPCPADVLFVTLNHLDMLRDLTKDDPKIFENIEFVYTLLKQQYGTLSAAQWQFIRLTLLQFFQDMHTKVSLFLKAKSQADNGWFVISKSGPVPYGTDVPGTIRYFDDSGNEVCTKTFPLPSTCSYQLAMKPGSIELRGDRGTKLGTNMYLASSVEPLTSRTETKSVDKEEDTKALSPTLDPKASATAGLKLLTQLLGLESKSSGNVFRLNLGTEDDSEETRVSVQPQQVLQINASQKTSTELTKIMDDMTVVTPTQAGEEIKPINSYKSRD